MARIKSGFKGERVIILPDKVVENFKNDTLGMLLHVTDIGYYPKAKFYYRTRTPEDATQYVFVYCVKGSGWVEVDGYKYDVNENQFFIIPKNSAHTYASDVNNPWSIYWIHFDGLQADYFSKGFDKPTSISIERNSRVEERIRLFDELYATLLQGFSKSNLGYSVVSFFHFMGTLKFMGSYRDSCHKKIKSKDVVEEAVHFMHENIYKKIVLNDIATFVKYSPSHFCTVFQEKTGYTPLNYFTQLKIQKACHFLDFTEMKISQIAMKLGYDDPFYFSRTFTRIMGISPLQYRNKEKG